jgi:hypothetical protein
LFDRGPSSDGSRNTGLPAGASILIGAAGDTGPLAEDI